MLDKSALASAIDSVLQDEARITAALVPGLAQLGKSDQAQAAQALARLRIEAIRRVWATADIHALALVAMLGEDYDAARSWAAYLEVAMNRDRRLLGDSPLDEARVRTTAPLRTTVALIETMARGVYQLGSLPAVAYALFVEWNQAHSTELAAALESCTRVGSTSRAAQREDYANKLVELSHRLITRQPAALPLLLALLRQHSAFIRASLGELDTLAMLTSPSPRQPEPPPQPTIPT